MLDPDLKIEEVVAGLELPTSMAFLGPDDMLILEKYSGMVRRMVEGQMLPDPILDVTVANENERGMLDMLGFAVENSITGSYTIQPTDNEIYVYLAFTESEDEGSDICTSSDECEEETEPLDNRLYRYEFINNALENPQLLLDLPATPGPQLLLDLPATPGPQLLLDLPATPGPAHNGGVVVIGPDNNIYVTIGDVRGNEGGIQR